MYVYTYEIKPTIKDTEQSTFLKLSHALQSIFAATLLPSNYYSHANFCPMNSFTFSGILYTWNHMLRAKLLQSCPTLCNPMDCSLPVSSVLGTFQARILEWVAFSSSRGSSQPGDQTPHLLHWQASLFVCLFTTNANWEAQEYIWNHIVYTFFVWLPLLSIIILRFIFVFVCINCSFLLIVELYFVAQMLLDVF